MQARPAATPGAVTAVINTAYRERLYATSRAYLTVLVRRTQAAARRAARLEAGMWLVGACYNFCWPHDSLWQCRGQVGGPHPRAGGGADRSPLVGA